MDRFLMYIVAILLIAVVCVFLNEKYVKIADEIALLITSLAVGVVLIILIKCDRFIDTEVIMKTITEYRLDKLLMEVLLCFMLFTGASELKLPQLVNNFKPICLLALLTTIISSAIYGALFWGLFTLLGVNMSFMMCFLLGSIVSPTDPIAATAILNKMGLTKNITAVMEGESLFNDGTGVALFIFIKNIIEDTKSTNFFAVMGRELFGAILVGLVVSTICVFFIKATIDPIKHIMISLLAVSSCYVICEHFGFSGVIASVICGIYFSTMMDTYKKRNVDIDPDDYYKDFWSIVDKLLNYILYVLIGISFVYVTRVKHVVIITIAAIVFNLAARYVGVLTSTLISRQCPDGYKIKPFTMLMTWSGLKGGLCLALAMSAIEYLPADAYKIILYITFVTIIFTTVVQGLTVGRVFNWLKAKYGDK